MRRNIGQGIDHFADGKASKGCDFYFGQRVGMAGKPLWFCDCYTADYRLTAGSIARNGTDAAFHSFKLTLEALKDRVITPKIEEVLRWRVKVAIVEGAAIDRRLAWKWYFAKWHRSAIFTLGGMRRFLMLIRR